MREQQVEVAVFLFLLVPGLLFSFAPSRQEGVAFPLLALSVIVRDAALLALVVFFLWKNREPLAGVGWRGTGAGREVVLGALLYLPLQGGAAALESALRRIGLSTSSGPPVSLQPSGGAFQVAMAVFLVLVVAIVEETIFRGYLILRLSSWTHRMWIVVLGSSVVFAIGHGYEGSAGVITVGALGAAMALVYLWRRSLIASITIHFLVDFGGIVLLPALARR